MTNLIDSILMAKNSLDLTFTEIADQLQLTENEVVEILFGKKAISATQCHQLSKLLGQPDGSIDELMIRKKPKGWFLEFLTKSVLDKLVIGIIAGLLAWFIQEKYKSNLENIEFIKSKSRFISEQAGSHIGNIYDKYKKYTESVLQLQKSSSNGSGTLSRNKFRTQTNLLAATISFELNLLSALLANDAENVDLSKKIFLNKLSELSKIAEIPENQPNVDLKLTKLNIQFVQLIVAIRGDFRASIIRENVVE